ncbi:hypothetical protein Tco_1447079 [Tanacetum coccineum]
MKHGTKSSDCCKGGLDYFISKTARTSFSGILDEEVKECKYCRHRVSCYTDAGYLTDADDLKSQTGYVWICQISQEISQKRTRERMSDQEAKELKAEAREIMPQPSTVNLSSTTYDNWDKVGPLCGIVSKRSIYYARLSDDAFVADIIRNGECLPIDWKGVIAQLVKLNNSNAIRSILRRLILAATVYYIWNERNKRLFDKENTNVDVQVRIVAREWDIVIQGMK